MSSFEEFIDKLGPYPNDVNRLTRLIRFLDKRVQNIQSNLNSQQKKFEAKLKELKEKKVTEIPPQLKAEYESIVQKQKQMYGYAKEKDAVAEQLLSVMNNSYDLVRNDLKNKIKDKPPEDQIMAATKKKKKPIQTTTKPPPKQEPFLYDNLNPRYCYCLGTSYGEMVCCQNTYCQKQWFHMECVEEKSALDENTWHCKDCKKLLEKYKKSSSIKEFL